jgi:hypothetical protein
MKYMKKYCIFSKIKLASKNLGNKFISNRCRKPSFFSAYGVKLIAFFIFFMMIFLSVFLLFEDNTPEIQWQMTFGGTDYDKGKSIHKTTDGGYIIASRSYSYDGDVSLNHGDLDVWVIKLGKNGGIKWQKSFGGTKLDNCNSIIQTSDGGYIFAGYSFSDDGDVSLNHGEADAWIVKLNEDGNLLWQKSLGGTNSDSANSIIETNDGGFVFVGTSSSNDGIVSGNHGLSDAWIVKLEEDGSLLWQKSFGGTAFDYALSVIQSSDGGLIFTGDSNSNDGDVSNNHGGKHAWVVKLKANGELEQQKIIGLLDVSEESLSIVETAKGGYVLAGKAFVNDDYDAWIAKLDSDFNILWQKIYGGTKSDEANSIIETKDFGYIFAGSSSSIDRDVTKNQGGTDAWIAKLNADGNILWQKSYGGSDYDYVVSIIKDEVGGLVTLGYTYSNDGDTSGQHGLSDVWIVKFAP